MLGRGRREEGVIDEAEQEGTALQPMGRPVLRVQQSLTFLNDGFALSRERLQ